MDHYRFFDVSILQEKGMQSGVGSVVRQTAHEQFCECGVLLQENGHTFYCHVQELVMLRHNYKLYASSAGRTVPVI